MAVATVGGKVTVQYKGIIEGFDPRYGTLNVELGDSIPAAGTPTGQNFLVAAAMPYGYVDPSSELFKDGETQSWRIDHIGVDAHALHFHLYNVQVLGYLDLAGQPYRPDANQLSWNETVRTEPFTAVFVTMQAIKPDVPWELPNSVHVLDPELNLGAVNGPPTCINNPFALQPIIGLTCFPFTQVDPQANPVNITNALINYGWEYVYHCHLLAHEEHDMMRPMSLAVAPLNAPTIVRGTTATTRNVATITDTTYNETDFFIEVGSKAATVASCTDPRVIWVQQGAAAWPFSAVSSGAGVGGTTTPQTIGGKAQVTLPASNTTACYRVRAANIVGCNARVPALVGGQRPTPTTACSDVFTGWPSYTVTGPASSPIQ